MRLILWCFVFRQMWQWPVAAGENVEDVGMA
jgi:hypothetical protein